MSFRRYIPVRNMRAGTSLGMNAPRSGKRFGSMRDVTNRDCAYWGESGEWYVVAARHRDSESITRSNFAVLLERLGGESDTVAIERLNHWAVGWVEYLLVHPANRSGLRKAIEAHCSEYDYPILDESHQSELEWTEFMDHAESELKEFENWHDVLTEKMEECNTSVGDESSEWDAIEASREELESREELYAVHAAVRIDPQQQPLFPGVDSYRNGLPRLEVDHA